MEPSLGDIDPPDVRAELPAFDSPPGSVTPDPLAGIVAPDPLVDADAHDPTGGVGPPDSQDVSVVPDPPAEIERPDVQTGHAAPDAPPIDFGDTNHVAAYHTPQLTNFGVEISCAECHGQDGAGGQNAAGQAIGGILGFGADVLAAHAQGNAHHPAPTGRADVKFPNLTAEDFDAIAAFLAYE